MPHDVSVGPLRTGAMRRIAALAAVLACAAAPARAGSGEEEEEPSPYDPGRFFRDVRSASETARTLFSGTNGTASADGEPADAVSSLPEVAREAIGAIRGVSTNVGDVARALGEEARAGTLGFLSGFGAALSGAADADPLPPRPEPTPSPPRKSGPPAGVVAAVSAAAAAAAAFVFARKSRRQPAAPAPLPAPSARPDAVSDVFVSYSRKDLAAVKAVKEELERLGFSCWMDLEGIESGSRQFSRNIIDAIDASKCMLFFLSSDSQASEWALKEIDYATDERKRVVLVRFNGDPMTKQFRFDFGRADIVDWREPDQKAKLLRNLAAWTRSGSA